MRVILFLLLLRLTFAISLKVQGQNMKVRISAFGDTITFKFIRPHEDSKLEGYILGYGSSMFSKQLIQLPEDGQPFETETDAEPKYLIAVQSMNPDKLKKQCTGKVDLEKPLNIVIGSVTESSVLLSWGTLLTTPFMDSIVEDCIDDGQFTVRYREKEPSHNWNYQTCPTTSTVIDKLKPDALYEFEVRADTETKSGVWSPPVIYNPADQIIEEPFKELNQAKKPVFPAVPVLKNITQAKPAPLLRHTVPPELQKTTEAERVTTASISPDDLTHSSQPPLFIIPTPKTTSQPSTTTPAPLTDQQYTSTQPPTTHQPSSTQQQTSTLDSTTHQHTTKQPLITTQQRLSKTSNPTPTQTKPPHLLSIVQENPITQENRQTGIQPSTKLQRLRTTLRSRGTFKHQTTDSYHFYRTTSLYPSSTMTLSKQQPNSKSSSRTQMVHFLPNIFLTSPTTIAKKQDDLVSEQATVTDKEQATVTDKQSIYSTNSFISKEYSTQPRHTTQEPALTESELEPTLYSTQSSTILWYQPQPSTTIQHSSSVVSTKPYPSTIVTAKYTTSQFAIPPPNPKEQLPVTSKNLEKKPTKSKPFTKSKAIQDSAMTEKVTVKKDPPSRQAVPSRSMDKQHLSNEVANRNQGRGIYRNSTSVSRPLARNVTQRLKPNGRVSPIMPTNALMHRNATVNRKRVPSGEHHIGLWGPKPLKEPRTNHVKTKTNQVSETKEKEKVIDLKQMYPMPLKPLASPTTVKPAYQESTLSPLQSAFNGSRFDTGDNSSMFSPLPVSEIDAMGRKRFVAPHVIYKTDKRPEEPCSVTHSLSFFPDEELGYLNVTGPPKTPISNLTVVTVEGCSSFVILDWEKADNETREYEVESTTKGPHGKEVSIVKTNQTHTAVENLKPESSYEFKVTPKNELGSGPTSDPVSFSTESADPRVSEMATGKNAIWSSFPFKADSYSECNGRQYIKRTWYRKFVGIQLCNSLRYKIYLSDSLKGKFYSIGDQAGYGEDHCQFVDSFLDGRTGGPLLSDELPLRQGFFRAVRQEPVNFGDIGGNSLINYVAWYECGIPIPGKW